METTMNALDRKRLLDVIEALSLAYPEATFGWRGAMERVVELWAMSLGDLPMPAIEAAVKRWIATQPKIPHISDIRGVITQAVNPVPSEGEVYAMRLQYIRGLLDDPFAERVYRSIGSPRDVGQMPLEGKGNLRETVGWAYRNLAGQERTERTAAVGELAAAGGLRAIS